MGWLFMKNATKAVAMTHILRQQSNEHGCLEAVAHCLRGNNLWIVRQWTQSKDGVLFSSTRYIVLFLMKKSDYGWGYKEISEDMGPCETNCPLSYLSLACPSFSVSRYSTGWRDKVRSYHSERNGSLSSLKENFKKAQDDRKHCFVLLKRCKFDRAIVTRIDSKVHGYIGTTPYTIPRKMIGESYVV